MSPVFQVLFKTTPHMTGSYSCTLADRAAAQAFVQRPDVWWWTFPLDEDLLSGSSWHRGGAWAGAGHIADAVGVTPSGPAPAEDCPLPAAPVHEDEEDGDDADRW